MAFPRITIVGAGLCGSLLGIYLACRGEAAGGLSGALLATEADLRQLASAFSEDF
jgi:tetrahydromethanopterin S-methyltransferase subunit C